MKRIFRFSDCVNKLLVHDEEISPSNNLLCAGTHHLLVAHAWYVGRLAADQQLLPNTAHKAPLSGIIYSPIFHLKTEAQGRLHPVRPTECQVHLQHITMTEGSSSPKGEKEQH